MIASIRPGAPEAVSASAITVQIQLGDPLRAIALGRAIRDISAALEEELGALAAEFGLHRKVVVEVVAATSARPIAIRAGGVLQRHSDAEIRAAWAAAAPDHVDLLVQKRQPFPSRLPGAWVPAAFALLPARGRQPVLARLIHDLALRVLREQPGDLFLDAVPPLDAALAARLDGSSAATSVAGFLAGQGMYPARHPEMEEAVDDALQITDSADDLAEILAARCPHSRLELVVGGPSAARSAEDEADLLELTRDEHETVLQAVDAWLQADLGLRLPPVGVARDPTLPAGTVAVRINDVTSAPIRLPARDQVLAEATPNVLANRGVVGETTLLPREQKVGSVVSIEDRGAFATIAQTWDRKETIALTLRSELERNAGRMVTLAAVEFALGQLEPYAPVLVQEALTRFSTPEITRIERALVEEGIPVRDLEAILERLVQFREVPMDSPDESLLDDAIPMNPAIAAIPTAATRRHVNWVRSGLPGIIGERLSQRPRAMFVARLDDEIDRRLSLLGWEGSGPRSGLDDHEWDETVDTILHQVHDGLPTNTSAVLLASRRARPVVHELLARDEPSLRVLGMTEIDWNRELIFMDQKEGPMAATVALVLDRAEQILRAEVGEALQRWEDGRLSFLHQGTEVIINVEPWEDRTVVTAWAELMSGLTPSPELYQYIASEASNHVFGHVVTLQESVEGPKEERLRLIFSHRILGDFLDSDELISVAAVVGLAAGDIRTELGEKFGSAQTEAPAGLEN